MFIFVSVLNLVPEESKATIMNYCDGTPTEISEYSEN